MSLLQRIPTFLGDTVVRILKFVNNNCAYLFQEADFVVWEHFLQKYLPEWPEVAGDLGKVGQSDPHF